MRESRPARLQVLIIGLLLLAATLPASGESVLIIGNSLVGWNDLPGDLEGLAAAGGHDLEVVLSFQGGASLSYHATFPPTLNRIASRTWDKVIVQESTLLPVIPYWEERAFRPAVEALGDLVADAGSEMALFLHWAYQDPQGPQCVDDQCSRFFVDFFDMQRELSTSVWRLGTDLGIDVVPVGQAWAALLAQEPSAQLWDVDELHPSAMGTYLVACVLYAYLFEESPVGLEYYGELPEADARSLQGRSWPLATEPSWCVVNPTNLDFGTVPQGESEDSFFTIVNRGVTTLVGDVATSSDQYAVVAGGGAFTLEPEEAMAVTVRFTPTVAGEQTAVIETGLDDCGTVACTGIGEGGGPTPPGTVRLLSSSPNPFRETTAIRFELDEVSRIVVGIYDAAGRLTRRLEPGAEYGAGLGEIPWDGRDDAGAQVPAGPYFIRLEAPEGEFPGGVVRVR